MHAHTSWWWYGTDQLMSGGIPVWFQQAWMGVDGHGWVYLCGSDRHGWSTGISQHTRWQAYVPVWYGDTGMDEHGWVLANTHNGGHTYLCGMGIQAQMSESTGSVVWAWVGESPGVVPGWFQGSSYLVRSLVLLGINYLTGSVSQLVGNTHDGRHTWVVLNVGVQTGGGGMGQSDGEKVKVITNPHVAFTPTLCSLYDVVVSLPKGIAKTDGISSSPCQQIFLGSRAQSAPAIAGWQNHVGSGALSVPVSAVAMIAVPSFQDHSLSPIIPESVMNCSPPDQVLSALVDNALSSVLGNSGLTVSSVLQRSDLQKPRLRVRSQLTNLQRCLAEEVLPPASVSSSELQLSALVIAFAILNPLGIISDPATVLDVHGRVLVWYLPGIMPPAREHLNKIHLPLKDSLVKFSKTGGQSKRRFGHKHAPEADGDGMFGHGRLMNSSATFQQAHTHFGSLIDGQRLEDKIYESSSLRKGVVRQWLQDISYAEKFWNTIADVVLPDLAGVGKEAISAKQHWVITQPPSPVRWPSIYLGIDVMVNQETPPHQDQASAPSLLDLVPSPLALVDVNQSFQGPLALANVNQSFQVKIVHPAHSPMFPIDLVEHASKKPTKTRRGKLTHKEVDAQHLYLPSGSQPSTPRTPRTMGSSQNLNFSDFPNSVDIPNSDWNDVEDPHQSQRHTKSQNDFVREWLPWRAEYLNVILEGEQLAKGGICEQCCEAEGNPDPDESGYMTGEEPPNHRQRLFPASISKPKTAFTFTVLDHFLIDALECKTSAMSFYQKLKRFTNNAFPERDRYRELMRVSQLWRDLKHRKWFGFGHDMEQDPGDGGLALFCPACPQPGVNLPADWKACYDRDTIMRQYVIDGNFTAQHMKMNKPELDVALSNGKGYMVAEVPYQSHLKQSLDSKEIFRKGRGCQWSINFRSRVKNSPPLLLPPALEIVPAVGKFHFAAHKLSCFPRYSLNFIKGAGHLDGEILETLWAPFNKISPTARSITQAHRQEVYDDHMRDSNWKKLVGMDALRAEADRGEALDIYSLKGDKAPTFQEVWLQLMKNPKSPSGNVGSVAWLAEGISIEDSQDQLRSEIQQLPSPMSTRQEVKISEKRQRLSSRIEKFHSNGQAFCKGLDINGTFTPQDDPAFCGSDEEEHEDREFWDDDEGDWEAPEEEVEGLALELMSIWMPSAIGAAKLTELGLHDLLKEERELRIGQANDCLDQLRTDLGNKAMTANSTREGTGTKKEIQKVVARVNKHVRSYQRARQAILRLDPDGNMAEKYQEILPEDLVVSKEVTEENRFGQGTSKLAWFWVTDGEKSQLNVEAGGLMEEFYRINWLKARARRDRWKEEVSLVRHEMLWTGLWFEYHKKMWEQRALQLTEPGKEAYANKQMGLWSDFASKARLMFHGKQMDGIWNGSRTWWQNRSEWQICANKMGNT
ncbi:hypothetical protein EDC04DRAFT_2610915 [Pisolithus marmoratus]|nr:hypothetical protein EDC04DRAFT_2610915 [Pisolithus marmoratus]